MALRKIYLNKSSAGVVSSNTEGYDGHYQNVITGNLSTMPMTMQYDFDGVRNLKKVHWMGEYSNGYLPGPGTAIPSGSGGTCLDILALPEGESDWDNAVSVWRFTDEGGSVDYPEPHPKQMTGLNWGDQFVSGPVMSIAFEFAKVIRATAVRIVIHDGSFTSANIEMAINGFMRQHEFICWEDDSDYFLGHPITLVNDSGTASIASTNNSHDGDLDTYDGAATWNTTQDIIWTFGGTYSLARVRAVVWGDTISPVNIYGPSGSLKFYYLDTSDVWQEFYSWSAADESPWYEQGETEKVQYAAGLYPRLKGLLDIKLATPVSAKGLKILGTNDEGGSAVRVYEMEAYSAEAQALTLESNATAAQYVPQNIAVTAKVTAGEAITINTDLVVSVSRDNGTTYTAVTLKLVGTDEDGNSIYAGSANVSGQPSGSNIKWKCVTGAKKIQIRGIGLNWA